MVGALGVGGVEFPCPIGKQDHEEKEEGAGDFKEEDSADTAEGAQKPAHSLPHPAGHNACVSSSLADGGSVGGGPAHAGNRYSRGGRRRIGAEPLTGHASGDAKPDSQYPANGLRFHPVYDVSSEAENSRLRLIPSWLLFRAAGSKVDGTPNSTVAHLSARPSPGGSVLNARLRELIQQLGEAIHESVIESEQIAGVVQDIRKHGFDVLLMLEATIGLNEVSAKEADAEETEEGAEEAPFTQTDRDWLRSLRISVEGDYDEDEPAEEGE